MAQIVDSYLTHERCEFCGETLILLIYEDGTMALDCENCAEEDRRQNE